MGGLRLRGVEKGEVSGEEREGREGEGSGEVPWRQRVDLEEVEQGSFLEGAEKSWKPGRCRWPNWNC